MLHLIFVSIWTRFILWEWTVDAWEAKPPLHLSFYSDAAKDDSPSHNSFQQDFWHLWWGVEQHTVYSRDDVSGSGSDAQKRPLSPLGLCSSWKKEAIIACKSLLALLLVTIIVESLIGANCAWIWAQPLILIVTAPPPCLLGTRLFPIMMITCNHLNNLGKRLPSWPILHWYILDFTDAKAEVWRGLGKLTHGNTTWKWWNQMLGLSLCDPKARLSENWRRQ